MSEISRVALFGKLNSLGYKAIEGATVFCKLRGNPYVELVHWIQQIVNNQDSDLHRILQHYEVDPSRLAADIIARDHMREICALPQVVESIQTSMDNSTMSASERLVRIAALAYLVCENDILPDDLPAGSGLIDDCITLRGARLATSTVLGTDYFTEDLVQIHYLSAAVPPHVLPTIESVLVHAATIAFQTRSLPDAVIEIAIRELIEHPPDHFPPGMALPDGWKYRTIKLKKQLRLKAPGIATITRDGLGGTYQKFNWPKNFFKPVKKSKKTRH